MTSTVEEHNLAEKKSVRDIVVHVEGAQVNYDGELAHGIAVV